MKKYTYHNKAILLLEYLVVNLIFLVFISFSIYFTRNIITIKKDIENSIRYDEIYKICDSISEMIAKENLDELNIKNKSISSNNFTIKKEKDTLVIYSSKKIRRTKLFTLEDINIAYKKNKIQIRYIIDSKFSLYRIICLK